jgi:ribosome-associated protein
MSLGQFVKLAGLAATGGEAKQLVVAGLVLVNGRIERRRGHKLAQGDVVERQGAAAQVVTLDGARPPGRSVEGRQELEGPGRSRPTRERSRCSSAD